MHKIKRHEIGCEWRDGLGSMKMVDDKVNKTMDRPTELEVRRGVNKRIVFILAKKGIEVVRTEWNF